MKRKRLWWTIVAWVGGFLLFLLLFLFVFGDSLSSFSSGSMQPAP